MPVASRQAMLASVRRDDILVGAYTSKSGGVCPMLGAHRRGGRCDLAEFARAWDRFTGIRDGKGRPATRRELRTLESMLEYSLAREAEPTDLGRAVAEVKAARRRRAAEAARRLGLGWMTNFGVPESEEADGAEADGESDAEAAGSRADSPRQLT
jgi:hypothetical protein